jgi:hypothetical protein
MAAEDGVDLSLTREQRRARESSREWGNWCGEGRVWMCHFIGAGGGSGRRQRVVTDGG